MTYRYWADLTSAECAMLAPDAIAVQPVGATARYGPHLPLSTDTYLTNAVIGRALPLLRRDQNVLILPTLTVTNSNQHQDYPGTLALSSATFLAVLADIIASVVRSDVQRILFLNGHAGNTAALDIAVRQARIDHNIVAAHASWTAFARTDGVIPADTRAMDLYAGDFATSAMLAARPDLVDMSKARHFRSFMEEKDAFSSHTGITGQPATPGWTISDLSPDGACGNATSATVEKGAKLLNSAASGLVRHLVDFASFDLRGRV